MDMSGSPLFVHGASIDTPDLPHWLGQQHDREGRPLLVRLPVVLRWGAGNTIEGAALGRLEAFETLPIELEDHTPDRQLTAQARKTCVGFAPCCLWLEGYWRGGEVAGGRLEVARVHRVASESELAAPAYAEVAVERGARADLVELATRMGSAIPLEEKRQAARALAAAGLDAVPILIASLGDDRAYETRDTTNRMNLPYGANPPVSMGTLTVGMRCEDLLYEIITPSVATPGVDNFKVFSEQKLRVSSWTAFWAARRGETLAQVQAPLKPLVEAYWREHGTTQIVP